MDLVEVNIKVEPEDEPEEDSVPSETTDPLLQSEPSVAEKVKRPKPPPPKHPQTTEMVNRAIMALHEVNGSSIQAIKKYIAENYDVDIQKYSPYIKKHLKRATAAGYLIQTSGKGAGGSFKIPGYQIDPARVKVMPKSQQKKRKRGRQKGTSIVPKKLKKPGPGKKLKKVETPRVEPEPFATVMIKEEMVVKTEPLDEEMP